MKKPLFLLILFCLNGLLSFSQSSITYNAAIPNYVQVGNAMNTVLTGTSTITVEGWCYLTTYPFLPTVIGNYGTGMQFLLRVDGNKPAFWVDGGSGFRVINGATTVPLNTWTHLAGVWDGSSLRVYINGILDGTASGITGAFNNTSNPVRIGASLTSETWTGKLDAVRVWKSARTVTEINATMNSCLTGTETNLLALYNFEEGSGTTVADLTGHGYTGTLAGSTIPVWSAGLACSATLPVNFTSVGANRNNNGIVIEWTVGEESDTWQYEIERSPDGSDFIKVGIANATHHTQYVWTDVNALQKQSYYRVKSVDVSGLIKYSGIIKVIAGRQNAAVTVWPNPVEHGELNIQFKEQPAGSYTINLSDAAGRLIFATALQRTLGNSVHRIQLSSTIRAGIYQLRVIANGKTAVVQKLFIKNAR
jgi:Concanavalin A-like lectin/glucanases superfamily/Secretion system C-terminal sorting domain